MKINLNKVFLFSGSISDLIVSFIVNLILIRFLMPEIFGQYAIFLTMIALIQMVLTLRLDVQIIRLKEINSLLKSNYVFISIVETLIINFVVLSYFIFFQELNYLIIILMISMSFWNIVAVQVAIYEKTFNYVRLTIFEKSTSIFGNLAAVLIVLLFINKEASIYIRHLVHVFTFLILLIYFKNFVFFRINEIKLSILKKIIFDGRYIWIDGILESLIDRIILIVSNIFGGFSITGIIFQSKRLILVPHQILSPIYNRLFYNEISQKKNSESKILHFYSTSKLKLLLYFLISIIIIIMPKEVYIFILGNNWVDAVLPIKFLTGLLISNTFYDMIKSFFISEENNRNLVTLRLSVIFLFVSLAFFFYKFSELDVAIIIAISISMAYFLPTMYYLYKIFYVKK